MSDLYKKASKLLKEHGFEIVRTQGSHQIWKGKDVSVSVPYKSTKRHTLNRALKDAGIDQKI